MRKALVISLLSALVFQCCHSDNSIAEATVTKSDSTFVRYDSTEKEEQPMPGISFNYTGTYNLTTTRNKGYDAYHSLILKQVNDTITGTYALDLYTTSNKLLANLKGNVNGKMNQSMDNVNSGSTLFITLTERNFDSLKLFSHPGVEYAIRQFLYEPTFGTRFSIEKNTIENNYAGGEWDTWQRIK